jgi:hypothetical protein
VLTNGTQVNERTHQECKKFHFAENFKLLMTDNVEGLCGNTYVPFVIKYIIFINRNRFLL